MINSRRFRKSINLLRDEHRRIGVSFMTAKSIIGTIPGIYPQKYPYKKPEFKVPKLGTLKKTRS